MKRFFLVGLMITALSAASGAQISGYLRPGPAAVWIGGGVATFNGQGVSDGSTSSTWDFGQRTSWQYRASLEKAIQNESSIGIVGTFVRVPFTYALIGPSTGCPSCGTTPPVSEGASCGRCSAHLDMMSLAALFHAGGGLGFHQVIEAAVGATAYRNLKRDSDGAALAPKNGNVDGSFVFGYGFGFGLSPNTEVFLIQDYGLILHENGKLPTGASNTNTVRTLRLTIRYGFGDRRR